MTKQTKDQILFDVHTHGVNLEMRDIYLHSFYKTDDEESGVDYRQSTTFIKNLHILDQFPLKPILIHMQSVGGCWDNGMAIFNSLNYAQSHITILAYAQASSMSGIILQAASKRVLMPDCHFLMHHGTSGGGVNHPYALKAAADFDIRTCDRMLQIFAARAIYGQYFVNKKSSTITTVLNFFKNKLKNQVDWYLSADEAVWYGLADDIIGSNNYPNVNSLRNQ